VTATSLAPLPTPFRWDGEHIAIDLGGMATALFTTRRGGVSSGPFGSLNLGFLTGDEPARIDENRERLLALTGQTRLLQGRQVHGSVVERVAEPHDERREADGQATARRDAAAVVLTADCLAVALASPAAVAMVHAGWKGLSEGVLEEGVGAVRELGGDGGPLVAAIGPAACGRCYEVRDDVRAALGLAPLGRPEPIDLKAIARDRLEAAGVETVHDAGLCTIHDDAALFFSHRRDRGVTGRQAGAVWRT
jgi:YfiH family protein